MGVRLPDQGRSAPRPALVRAGGGIVWRRVAAGLEIVLVHRPAYDDWAFPKGKAEPGETDEEAALREVREETGLSCRLGAELPSTTYEDGQGRPKMVRYWSMTVIPQQSARGPGAPTRSDRADYELEPEPKARGEIDDLFWASLEEGRHRLTYPRDVLVLDGFCDLVSRSDVGGQEVNEVLEGEPEGD